MADKPFVINDRRKFTAEGELRPDAAPSEPKPIREEQVESSASHAVEAGSGPKLVPDPEPGPQTMEDATDDSDGSEDRLLPAPTAEQTDQANRAYQATVERLDTAIRATNPGMERIPEMSFERVVQSLYMQALLQLGGAAEPGQTPQVDLLGARQTIDMLNIIDKKTTGNLTEGEATLVQSALFELRMGFLEVTQALARQANIRPGGAPGAPGGPPFPPPGGPSIVR